MIKTRNLDKYDIHKLVQIPIFLGTLTDASEATASKYIVPNKCVLTGMQVIIAGAIGNADNTLNIRLRKGSLTGTVLVNDGAPTITASSAARYLATNAVESPAPDTALAGLALLAASDVIFITDVLTGTSKSATGVSVVLELHGV